VGSDIVEVSDGLATLGASQLAVLRALDRVVLAWAEQCSAAEIAFPPLTPVAHLARVDYFLNFPQLASAAATLRPTSFPSLARGGAELHVLDSDTLADTCYVLPSAACYPVYAHLAGRTLADSERITTVQQCFRNETSYEGLARLRSFTMREIVCVGSHESVKRFLAGHKQWIRCFAEAVDVALSVQTATDPFFDASGSRATMQRLFPVKEEFLYEGSVAVASVNFHRNFFAERWAIRTADGQHAFSGCVAFGLERWYHALAGRYGRDSTAMVEAVERAAQRACSLTT